MLRLVLFVTQLTVPADSEAVIARQAGVAVYWNYVAFRTASDSDRFTSFVGLRAITMVHLAMHDALNAIVSRYQPYAYTGHDSLADSTAAPVQAAVRVLSEVYPRHRARFEADRDRWLSGVRSGDAKRRGLALGDLAAAAIITRRAGDGSDVAGTFQPDTSPGEYRYTPGVTAVYRPGFRYAKPFALQSPDQFRPPPPPALTSAEYTRAFDEVKRLGASGSAARSPQRTALVYWWAELAEESWNRIARAVATSQHLSLWDATRLFALVNMDVFDVYSGAWDGKYHYHTWRPYTGIHLAGLDGNPATALDSAWQPELRTPPSPEYPSTNAAVCGGGAEVLTRVLGTDRVPFRIRSTTARPGSELRAYDELNSVVQECADSRVVSGYHFRFSIDAGEAMGRSIARYLVTNYLQPLRR
jgi:hypothetical protein